MKVDGSKRCESPGKQQLIPLSLTCLTSARYLAPSRPLLVSQSPPTCLLILFGLLPPAFQLCRLPPTSPWSSTCCPLFPACFPLLRGLFPICHPLSPTAFLLASPWSRRSCPRTCLLLVSTCLPLVSCLSPSCLGGHVSPICYSLFPACLRVVSCESPSWLQLVSHLSPMLPLPLVSHLFPACLSAACPPSLLPMPCVS
jgi:hypothetical protein